MKTWAKFALLAGVIVGTLAWLAVGGINETKTYYKTIAELHQMGPRALDQKIRVGGDIQAGSIQRSGREVLFTLTQDRMKLNVVYSGIDPLPDTFRDGAQALADGRLGRDGIFHASKIQAKCASKYEAKPGRPAAAPAM
ncbi:MAG TPA: cytochrome c maturation protein CcmE [Bryobacteraceae bacterium]|jgi:cytochrome c-type biogenesis protein CcmE|nr:cytochrome c maturation protein CcmE [Bryobacteraceae bacterium]